jgi:hypothetical protein
MYMQVGTSAAMVGRWCAQRACNVVHMHAPVLCACARGGGQVRCVQRGVVLKGSARLSMQTSVGVCPGPCTSTRGHLS